MIPEKRKPDRYAAAAGPSKCRAQGRLFPVDYSASETIASGGVGAQT